MLSEQRNTILVNIKFLGFLRKWRKAASSQVEIQSNASVYDLLSQVAQDLGEEFRAALWDHTGQLHGGLELILNGRSIPAHQIKNVRITEDSELAIIPIIEGGYSF
jgi:molybdopterin converting factor small subunit